MQHYFIVANAMKAIGKLEAEIFQQSWRRLQAPSRLAGTLYSSLNVEFSACSMIFRYTYMYLNAVWYFLVADIDKVG